MVNDERALLERAQKSVAGFGELFDAYYDRIYAYAYRRVGSRETAEDIAATVFEDALRGLNRVRWQGKPVVAWLYRIASRRVADFYRGTHADSSLDESIRLVDDPPSDAIERADEYAAVRCGLAKLSVEEREIIQLAYFDELDGTAIAAILNCTTNNVYVRLHRALGKLKVVLSSEARGGL